MQSLWREFSGLGQRLIGGGQHLLGAQFLQADAFAADMPLAALEGAGQARQRILHDPDVAAILDRAARLPRRVHAADRPGSPDAGIGRPEQRHRRAARGGGEMGDRGVGPDIDARACEQRDVARPRQRMDGGGALPQRFEIAALRRVGPAGRDDGQAAPRQSRGERAPALARPLLVAERRRGMDHRIVARPECSRAAAGAGQTSSGTRAMPSASARRSICSTRWMSGTAGVLR